MKKFCFSDIYYFNKIKGCYHLKKIYKKHILFRNRNDFEINKTSYLNIAPKSSLYISSSNYLLQKDFLDLQKEKKVNIQSFNEKEQPYIFHEKDLNNIVIKEKSYLLRSYLTSINYDALYYIGLSRIEQFLLLLYSNFLTFYTYKGLLFSKKKDYIIKINKNKKIKNHYKIININKNIYSSLDFVLYVSKSRKVEPFWVLDALYKEFVYHLNITDPFIGEFEVLKEDNFLFKKELNAIKATVKKIDFIIEGKENRKNFFFIMSKAPDFFSFEEKSVINNYLHFYILNDKNGKELKVFAQDLFKSNVFSLYYLSYYNSFFLPIEDFFHSLYNLLKMDYISFSFYGNLYPNETLKEYLLFEHNDYFLSLQDLLNKFKNFCSFKDEILELPFFPLIKTKQPSFSCPICNGNQYVLDYDFLKCKDKNCGFLFNRKNLSKQGIKSVLLKDIIKGLVFPSVYIENKDKQKKLFIVKEYAPFRYSLTLKNFNNPLKN